ncbi:MAG: Hpt domain-containing protein, partial [Psychrobacter celer]
MKNQPNDIVTLEWLLPLFNQQLSQVSDGWQLDADSINYEHMVVPYHQLGGALIMSNLPALADLAYKLSALAEVGGRDGLASEARRVGQLAHRLLQRALNQYARIGSHHTAPITAAAEQLLEVLTQLGAASGSSLASSAIQQGALHQKTDTDAAVDGFELAVPVRTDDVTEHLDEQQYQQLLLVWRQQVQVLLSVNSNQPPLLTPLEKVSQYLRQTSQEENLQRLWYLTELWFSELAQNTAPLPKQYAPLLSELEQIIDAFVQQTPPVPSVINSLITNIYIELSGLDQSSDNTQSLLSNLPQSSAVESRFLPRILSELETLVFHLDKPTTLLYPLQKIQTQLEGRGWTYYAAQVAEILTEIEQALASEAALTQVQWQIEQKLQELYSAIYNTEQVISQKIGEAAAFVPFSDVLASANEQPVTSADAVSAGEELRELRIAVEDVKQSFNEYIQRQEVQLLPTTADFAKIGQAFDDMGLPTICQTTDQIAHIFSQLKTHEIDALSWDVTQALAEALTSIELLLDYLAQQVFDQQLLTLASEHTARAEALLDAYIEAPEMVSDTFHTQTPAATDVLRYDDSGEIAPASQDLSAQPSDDAPEDDNMRDDNV